MVVCVIPLVYCSLVFSVKNGLRQHWTSHAAHSAPSSTGCHVLVVIEQLTYYAVEGLGKCMGGNEHQSGIDPGPRLNARTFIPECSKQTCLYFITETPMANSGPNTVSVDHLKHCWSTIRFKTRPLRRPHYDLLQQTLLCLNIHVHVHCIQQPSGFLCQE